jgi:hypothetical protein
MIILIRYYMASISVYVELHYLLKFKCLQQKTVTKLIARNLILLILKYIQMEQIFLNLWNKSLLVQKILTMENILQKLYNSLDNIYCNIQQFSAVARLHRQQLNAPLLLTPGVILATFQLQSNYIKQIFSNYSNCKSDT